MVGSYSGDGFFDALLALHFAVAGTLLGTSRHQGRAPYGRFGSAKRHVSLDPRLGWFLMELPALVCFAVGFSRGQRNLRRAEAKAKAEGKGADASRSKWLPRLFACVWLQHYGNRAIFYPLSIRAAGGERSSFALFNSALGAFIVGAHGYLNGRSFSDVQRYSTEYWSDARLWLGLALYEAGWLTTVSSEAILRNLRPAAGALAAGTPAAGVAAAGVAAAGVTAAERYKVPMGGLFRYVTSPHYLGEIMCFSGLFTMTSQPAALPIILITLANLVPRAAQNQKWYMAKFAQYPKDRRMLIPFLY